MSILDPIFVLTRDDFCDLSSVFKSMFYNLIEFNQMHRVAFVDEFVEYDVSRLSA